jgi:U2 small nuclear ribonucleoprotein A'
MFSNNVFSSRIYEPLERQHYRLYAIHRMPALKVLDFERVKPSERDRASRLASSAAGAALESDVQAEARETTRTFTPGEDLDVKTAVIVNFTAEEKEQIRVLLAGATTVKQVEEIENAVQRGVLPEALMGKRKRDNATPDSSEEESVPAKKVKA